MRTVKTHCQQIIIRIATAILIIMVCFQPVLAIDQSNKAVSLFNEKCSGCHTIGGGSLIGPDLKAVTNWSQEDAAAAVKRMERNAGPLSDDEVKSLVSFLKNADASKQIKAAEQKATEPAAGVEIEKGIANSGEQLFDGAKSFTNGGMACIACHQVDNVGGTMAPDLTNIATKMGQRALASACEQTSFKIMKAAYRDHPVTKQEALDLTAYFVSLKESHSKNKEIPVPLYAVAIVILMLGVIGIGYRNRNSSVRSKLKRR